MSDTLELAKQCGCDVIGEPDRRVTVSLNGHIVFVEGNLQAFRDACVKEATEELQARVAMQDELLRASRCPNTGCDNHGTIAHHSAGAEPDIEQCQFCFDRGESISATSETVAAWKEQRDKEVAAKALEDAAKACLPCCAGGVRRIAQALRTQLEGV